ncbi:hypothetical protein ACFW35_18435 [Fictibacillus sp. NPDC058756]|uniref:hypothetical protein n=1 Tax=Fictibacillus sp. NPDC058756 TaxID=3346625 RepID=UPI00367B5C5B
MADLTPTPTPCSCNDPGDNQLLCVAIPGGIEINLLGLDINIGPICINTETTGTGARNAQAQLGALQGLLGFLGTQL